MIACKKCGSENPAYELICSKCDSEFSPDTAESLRLVREAEDAVAARDFRTAVDIYRFLAGLGNPVGEREFAIMLERGQLIPRDIPMAEKYFASAAKKGDATAAYRYSRLLSRLNQDVGEFWLELSALLGCNDAYSDAVRLYNSRQDEDTAAYYSSLLALDGDPDAIVDMTRRHIYGNGVSQNEHYAKWYINQLKRVPIYAIGLSHKLHTVKDAYKPPVPKFTAKPKILRSLIGRAKQYGLRTVLVLLADIFSDSDAKDAAVDLAYLYIEGVEFEQNVELGIAMLTEAADDGSSTGARYLAELYAKGKYVEQDKTMALKYYTLAMELGCDGAYEEIADFFSDGELTNPNLHLALSLYESGANEGSRSCAAKAAKIRRDRERQYLRALEIEKTNPDEAFKLLLSSVSAGYTPAHAKIAPYYEKGIVTEQSNKTAFYHYKTAADAKDYRAAEGLGRCYAHGIGTAFNFKLASKYLSIAKDNGSLTADRELYRIYENKKKHMLRSLYSTAIRLYHSQKISEAKQLISVCVDMGLPEAIYTMGCLYEFGITLPASREIAVKYYKKATDLGYCDNRGAHKQWLLKKSKQIDKKALF